MRACSAVWLDNATDRPVSFRLHVPVTPLTAPPPPQGTDPTDVHIGPLKPSGGAHTLCMLNSACRILMHHARL